MHPQLLFVSLTLVAVTSAAPWFCQGHDCPEFTTEDHGAYDIRYYNESQWVATSMVSYRPDLSSKETKRLFMELFHYIGGDNNQREKIKMSVPVLTKTERRGRRYKITMMFYLPDTDPPKPTDKSVFLVTRPAGRVFVRSFPTWRWPSDYWFRVELGELTRAIGNSQLYDKRAYFRAGYNSPYDFGRKQHEVWVDAKA